LYQPDYYGCSGKEEMTERMATSTSVSKVTLTETNYFNFLIDYAIQHHYSIALWRLPLDSKKYLVISKHHEYLKYTAALEDLPPGFIFAPFKTTSDRIFLKADFLFSFSNNQLNPAVTPLEIESQTWLNTISADEIANTPKKNSYYTSDSKPQTTDRDFFLDLVNNGITEIEKGSFEKVVISRTQNLTLSPDFEIGAVFQKLCARYANALVSFVTIPEAGSWLGATPELLVSVENKGTFKTTALAGTLQYTEGMNLKTVAWTQKDIEEQALVERYIISCFKKIRLREYEEHGPRTIVAGNLLHLKSDFTVDMVATNFPQLGSVMLQLLHPTSAVCGVPLDTSLEFLHHHERYERQFYTGYLGPVNFLNDIHIYVNLRCLQLVEDAAILYAGAGITQDSVPEKEWEETELKLNTLLKVIEE
jgi:isochorismate synthase